MFIFCKFWSDYVKIIIGQNEKDQRLDKFLRKWLKDVPLAAIFKVIRVGDVKINGKREKDSSYILKDGEEVEVFGIDKFVNGKKDKGEDLPFTKVNHGFLKVHYEDKNILLIEKWPGVLVHSDKEDSEPTLNDYVLSYLYDKGDYNPKDEISFIPSSCNRLDRNTQGMVLYGKNNPALKELNAMIKEDRLDKYYIALITSRIRDGVYKAYIIKDKNKNISKVVEKSTPESKEISMEVKTLESCGIYSLIEIRLITGRSHQIRAHLNKIGNFIVGDSKYGNKKINNFFVNKYGLNYQFLYAYKYVFKDPRNELLYLKNHVVTASLPPVFKKIKTDVFKF